MFEAMLVLSATLAVIVLAIGWHQQDFIRNCLRNRRKSDDNASPSAAAPASWFDRNFSTEFDWPWPCRPWCENKFKTNPHLHFQTLACFVLFNKPMRRICECVCVCTYCVQNVNILRTNKVGQTNRRWVGGCCIAAVHSHFRPTPESSAFRFLPREAHIGSLAAPKNHWDTGLWKTSAPFEHIQKTGLFPTRRLPVGIVVGGTMCVYALDFDVLWSTRSARLPGAPRLLAGIHAHKCTHTKHARGGCAFWHNKVARASARKCRSNEACAVSCRGPATDDSLECWLRRVCVQHLCAFWKSAYIMSQPPPPPLTLSHMLLWWRSQQTSVVCDGVFFLVIF